MPTVGDVIFEPVEGAVELFTPVFCEYFTHMHDTFGAQVAAVRVGRKQASHRGVRQHQPPSGPPPGDATTQDWLVPSMPAELRKLDVEIKRPEGEITLEGTRQNLRNLIECVEGWLNGRGAKGIDSLAGRPGLHPALIEDLATARISVAQIAQSIINLAKDVDSG